MKTKTVKLALNGYGSYLGMEKGCFVVKDKQGNIERYPLFENEVSEVQSARAYLVYSVPQTSKQAEHGLSYLLKNPTSIGI
jgi:hypothetical protein